MKKIFSVFTSCIIIATTITGCSSSEVINDTSSMYNVKNLDFNFEVKPETFEVSVESNGLKEKISEPLKERKVSNFKKTKTETSWTYPDENIDINIKKEESYLDVDIKSNSEKEASFNWPRIEGESYVLPLYEGKFIPSDDKYWKEHLNESAYNVIESFSMQFFAVNKTKYSVLYIIENEFNNEIKFNSKDKINFTFTHEYPSINKNKEYGFKIYLTDKNITDVAKTYKNYIVDKGEFKTLEEKSKDNENIKKLYGAPQIYFADKSIITVSDIKWDKLKKNLSDDLINWMKELLSKKPDNSEFITVLDQIRNQDYIDKYQKNQIVQAFNQVMQLNTFYNSKVFDSNDKEIKKVLDKGISKLNRVELIEFNKKLLKSKLGDSVNKIDTWARYNTIDVINDMNKSGIDNAWIGFDDMEDGYVSPEIVKRANDLGYLVGPYDSYHSIHKPGEEKWSTAAFKDKSLYENATIENKKGEKESGFQGEGRQLNPTLSLPSVKERVKSILDEGYKFNSWFIDCDATGEIFDDYSPNHITTQSQDLKARLERMSYIRDNANMVIGSEGGNDFASGTIAFAHGLETPAFAWVDKDMSKNKESEYYVGRYYSPTGGVPEVFSKQIPVKEKYKKIFIDPTYSLPLFRLVYNDSVVSSHQWLWGTFKIKDEVGSRMMKEVLYNTPPMYYIDRTEWEKHKGEIISHDKVWSEFNKKAIKREMTDFEFISDDRLVQMTKYGEDLKVVANFSGKDVKYENEIVKSNSLVIYDNNKKVIYKPEQ
ncbi:glycoside hydrolase [Clostridioides sp. ZZV14-6154]|uniref:glycoside hydrolase n=1 Tax=unclassified Clostridioides TaxID=2635829 RepID=UPI001D129F0A|nr:glycoside hydrolase [Clostridioides sp. ZZV14-6154]MCC0725160.1 glycoside hydrolase [Clostridioides sp. ZZV14-6045]MCC0733527.1 glycoside hydrolase [Clostridioides sp. ZZV14-6009]MCC0736954.1 glycoside hydrolase [Clostridioides sp. ZZV14-5902]MCC0744896.1 glycoside hydrolase [Clostridioides sp. ZZV14-6044]